MQIIRNISREERFFEIIKSMPKPKLNLYSGTIFAANNIAVTIAEAKNKDGICLYRYIPEFTGSSKFEKKFKELKKELENV